MIVEVTIRPSLLQLVNILFSKIRFYQNKQGYIDKSIATNLAVKLAKKQFSLLGKDRSKDYKLSLHYHDAELLERKIRAELQNQYESLNISEAEYLIVNEFCNKLHQKMTTWSS
jgi:hypothetical protein